MKLRPLQVVLLFLSPYACAFATMFLVNYSELDISILMLPAGQAMHKKYVTKFYSMAKCCSVVCGLTMQTNEVCG